MAKNRNTFEKNRREVEKKRKAEEKRLKKRLKREAAQEPEAPPNPAEEEAAIDQTDD